MKKITRVSRPMPTITRRKKVAAYARVSVESERMNHSLSAQISYYNGLIQRNPEWEFAGVYADDGISGTTIDKRKGFKQMLADCEAGKIDIILTKSIQRFARNTVDLLTTVRHLKDLGIEVRFEKEHIRSLECLLQFIRALFRSFHADLRLCSGAEPFCKLLSDLHGCRRLAVLKSLFICINSDEFNACDILIDHAVYGIITRTADTDNDDSCR